MFCCAKTAIRNLQLAIAAILLTVVAASAQSKSVELQLKTMVNEAVEDYRANGAAALPRLNDPQGPYRQGELYVFVFDHERLLASSGNPDDVGALVDSVLDWDGTPVSRRIRQMATPEVAWATYHHRDPSDGKVEHKRSWVRAVGDVIVGAGYYSH